MAYLSLGLQFFSDGFKVTVDDCVLKPVQRPPKGEREISFYEAVFDKAEERNEVLQLRRFLPQYFGVVELGILTLTISKPATEQSNCSFSFPFWVCKR